MSLLVTNASPYTRHDAMIGVILVEGRGVRLRKGK